MVFRLVDCQRCLVSITSKIMNVEKTVCYKVTTWEQNSTETVSEQRQKLCASIGQCLPFRDVKDSKTIFCIHPSCFLTSYNFWFVYVERLFENWRHDYWPTFTSAVVIDRYMNVDFGA